MEGLESIFGNAREERAQITYELIKKEKTSSRDITLVYRCKYRCTLLEIFDVDGDLAFHKKRYRLSQAENDDRSSPAGRAANMEHGDGPWKAECGMVPSIGILNLNCAHVLDYPVGLADIRRELGKRREIEI